MATATDNESDGPLARWTQKAIQDPERLYRALFYVAMAFFLVTTLFPFYWLLVLAVTPSGRLLAGSFLPSVDLFGVSATFPLPVPKGFNPASFITVFEQVPFHLYMLNRPRRSSSSWWRVWPATSSAGFGSPVARC